MKFYKLTSSDSGFLSIPRICFISQEIIKPGDEVCICTCNTIMLKSSWIANNRKCPKCCSGALKNLTKEYLNSNFRIASVEGRRRERAASPQRSTSRRRPAQQTNPPLSTNGYSPNQSNANTSRPRRRPAQQTNPPLSTNVYSLSQTYTSTSRPRYNGAITTSSTANDSTSNRPTSSTTPTYNSNYTPPNRQDLVNNYAQTIQRNFQSQNQKNKSSLGFLLGGIAIAALSTLLLITFVQLF